MKVPEIIGRLVERFERNIEAYKSGGYKEANVRSEFIEPFFEALRWDVYAVGYERGGELNFAFANKLRSYLRPPFLSRRLEWYVLDEKKALEPLFKGKKCA